MGIFTRKFIADDGRELEVDGSFRFAGRDNIEVTSYKAWLWADRDNASAPDVTLTDDEDQRLYEELMMAESTWEYDDDFD